MACLKQTINKTRLRGNPVRKQMVDEQSTAPTWINNESNWLWQMELFGWVSLMCLLMYADTGMMLTDLNHRQGTLSLSVTHKQVAYSSLQFQQNQNALYWNIECFSCLKKKKKKKKREKVLVLINKVAQIPTSLPTQGVNTLHQWVSAQKKALE